MKELTLDGFEEYLNDLYGEIKVCGQTYSAGTLFRAIDPAAFEYEKGIYEDYLEGEE